MIDENAFTHSYPIYLYAYDFLKKINYTSIRHVVPAR